MFDHWSRTRLYVNTPHQNLLRKKSHLDTKQMGILFISTNGSHPKSHRSKTETESERNEKHSDIMTVNENIFSTFFSVEFRSDAHHTDIIWSMSILIYYLYVIRHDTADLRISNVFLKSTQQCLLPTFYHYKSMGWTLWGRKLSVEWSIWIIWKLLKRVWTWNFTELILEKSMEFYFISMKLFLIARLRAFCYSFHFLLHQ